MEVVAQRLGVALDPTGEQPHAAVAGGGERAGDPAGRSTRRTSESQRAVSATCSITSLDHTMSNAPSSKGSGPSISISAQIEMRMAAGGPVERRLGDVDGRHLRAGAGQVGGEIAGPAAQVEDALPRPNVVQRKPAAGALVGGDPGPRAGAPRAPRSTASRSVNVSPRGRGGSRRRWTRAPPPGYSAGPGNNGRPAHAHRHGQRIGLHCLGSGVDGRAGSRPAPSRRRRGGRAGGAETTLLRLLARLQEHGRQVTLATPADGPLRAAAASAGHRWLALPVGWPGRPTSCGDPTSAPRTVCARRRPCWTPTIPT